MKIITTLIMLLTYQVTSSPYSLISDLNTFYQEFSRLVPGSLIHNVTHLSTGLELCGGKSCQFFYYESYDQTFKDDNLTLFLVGGFHGTEVIGPMTLMYAYKHLHAHRIIYFPMANPSGFCSKTRVTYPNSIDPNRDYPIDKNKACYRASSTRIIDHIYRYNQVDMTVALHNGGNEIAFNWGNIQQNSHTKDYQIYYEIAKMLQLYGGYNYQCNAKELAVGTMTEVVFVAEGTFDDWAYGASNYLQLEQCTSGYTYPNYPPNMMNGLVFLWELGPFNIPENCLGDQAGVFANPIIPEKENGFISRGIRMLIELTYVLHPRVEAVVVPNRMLLKVKGCARAMILTIIIKVNEATHSFYNVSAFGSVSGKLVEPIEFAIRNLSIDQVVNYSLEMECDSHWVGQGSTKFAAPRRYNRTASLKVLPEQQIESFEEFPPLHYTWTKIVIVLLIVTSLGLFGLVGLLWICKKMCLFLGFDRNVQVVKFVERFEEVQYEQELNESAFQHQMAMEGLKGNESVAD